MSANPFDFTNDATQRQLEATADKIAADPSLLRVPLENIDRWIAQGHDAVHRLEQWRGLIEQAQRSDEGMEDLLTILRDDGEAARHLKSYSPFSGVLSVSERRAVLTRCATIP